MMKKRKDYLNKLVVMVIVLSLFISNVMIPHIDANAASGRMVKNLTVSNSSVVMNVGQKKYVNYKVTATAGTNKGVKLKVSKSKVISAKIQKGKICINAKSVGKATITVITKAPNKKGKSLKKHISVEVKNNANNKKNPSGLSADTPSGNGSTDQSNKPSNGNSTDITSKNNMEMPSIKYQAHVQDYGWQKTVNNGDCAGTTGQAKRLEAIKIFLNDKSGKSIIKYRTHVQDEGWQSWKSSGEIAGTEGKAKRMEAINIALTGSYASSFDIYYRVHVHNFGWLGWAKNGETAGSVGNQLAMEAVQIKIMKKGDYFDVGKVHSIDKPIITYQAHCQDYGWKAAVNEGVTAGTTGQAKRLEALIVNLKDYNGSNGIEYRAHIQNEGWQSWKTSGQKAGTEGQGKRLEAVQINLKGSIANYYDVYYRVHVHNYGWLGWAKNGEMAGTTGCSLAVEAIEIKLLCKVIPFDVGGVHYFNTIPSGIHLKHYMTQSLKQPYSGPCCAYAYGIGLSIVLKKNVNPMQFYYNGEAHYDWGRVGAYHTYNATEIYNALKSGKPTMIHFTYPGSQHWVLIIGVREGANVNNLQYGDFICIDSAKGAEVSLTSAYGFSSGTVKGIKVFQ